MTRQSGLPMTPSLVVEAVTKLERKAAPDPVDAEASLGRAGVEAVGADPALLVGGAVGFSGAAVRAIAAGLGAGQAVEDADLAGGGAVGGLIAGAGGGVAAASGERDGQRRRKGSKAWVGVELT